MRKEEWRSVWSGGGGDNKGAMDGGVVENGKSKRERERGREGERERQRERAVTHWLMTTSVSTED